MVLQRVVVGEVAQPVLGALARLDVLRLHEEVERGPVAVADERRAHHHPRRRPAMGDQGELLEHLGHLTDEQLARTGAEPRHVVRKQQAADVAAGQRLAGAARDAGERAVDAQQAPVEPDHGHADRRGLERVAELLLRAQPLLLLAAAVGDVGEGDDHRGAVVLRQVDERGGGGEPTQLAVRPADSDHDAAELPARLQRHPARPLLHGQRRAVLAHQRPTRHEHRVVAHLLRADAVDACGRRVPRDDRARRVLHEDALLECLEDGPVARSGEDDVVAGCHLRVVGRRPPRLELDSPLRDDPRVLRAAVLRRVDDQRAGAEGDAGERRREHCGTFGRLHRERPQIDVAGAQATVDHRRVRGERDHRLGDPRAGVGDDRATRRLDVVAPGVRADHDADPAVAGTRLDDQLVEAVERLGEAVGAGEVERAHGRQRGSSPR
jgi:hypothetical protein